MLVELQFQHVLAAKVQNGKIIGIRNLDTRVPYLFIYFKKLLSHIHAAANMHLIYQVSMFYEVKFNIVVVIVVFAYPVSRMRRSVQRR